MFLKHKDSGKLVELLGLIDLFNPMHKVVVGRYHAGEELQDPEQFRKEELIFCSGEPLPKCWTDVHYRDDEAHHHYRVTT
jgi:hypothetical protein